MEPIPGLRLIAMDSCIYNSSNKNNPGQTVNLSNYTLSITGGTFSPATLSWIQNQIINAKANGKTIIGMMHHGIVPHFSEQPVFFPDFVLQNYAAVGTTLSSLGLNVVFTGHFHAQNISKATYNSNTLLDIETGSLVTYPIPIRSIKLILNRDEFEITTSRVTSTASFLPYTWNGVTYPNFQSYALGFLTNVLPGLFATQLADLLTPQYGSAVAASLSTQIAAMPVSTGGPTIAQLYTAAMIAHYQGDYTPSSQTQSIYTALATSTMPTYGPLLQELSRLLESLGNMNNLPRLGDNNLNVNFKTATLDSLTSWNTAI